jgi:hypothetical protein
VNVALFSQLTNCLFSLAVPAPRAFLPFVDLTFTSHLPWHGPAKSYSLSLPTRPRLPLVNRLVRRTNGRPWARMTPVPWQYLTEREKSLSNIALRVCLQVHLSQSQVPLQARPRPAFNPGTTTLSAHGKGSSSVGSGVARQTHRKRRAENQDYGNTSRSGSSGKGRRCGRKARGLSRIQCQHRP